ncbi:MAG TPA: DUF5941 domain-containing protein [Baekduia sp.]|nr:DUF5941 domain-containing protein [Baekduia sp.]
MTAAKMPTIVHNYRDDGPLATWLQRRLPLGERIDPLALTIIGMLALGLVLLSADEVGALAVGAAAVFVILAAGAGATEARSRLAWMCPPLLRGFEYAVIIRVTAMAAGDAMPACYALLGVLALHHYDMVYRLRHQSAPPPAWINAVGGGWDGRVLLVVVLGLIGGDVLTVVLIAVAAGLAVIYVTESVNGWRRYSAASATGASVDFDDEGLEQG